MVYEVKQIMKDMKKGIITILVAALAGAVSAYAVVKLTDRDASGNTVQIEGGTQFRTVELSNDE